MLRALAALLALLAAGCLDGVAVGPGGDPPPSRPELLLLNDHADRITLRTYSVPGREANPQAMQWLAGRIQDLTGKAEVTVAPDVLLDRVGSVESNWSSAQVDGYFQGLDVPSEPRTFQLVFLFLDGHGYNGYTTAAGWQAPDYIAIWPDTFRGAGASKPVRVSVPLPDPAGSADHRVLLHETGHMLGLVDNGVPMVRDHVDASDRCRCHSSNPDSIMFTGADSVEALVRHATLEPQDFDADDLADLKAFQAAPAR